jgi:RNA polymerase sigma-70 factor (ECF subfamily)
MWESLLTTSRNERDQSLEDKVLVERAKKDRAAFEALYSKYISKVYTYAYYRTGTVEDAEDITESVFLHAFLNLDRYRYMGLPFSAWLMRIAHNLIANWYRDKSKKTTVSLEHAEHVTDTGRSPEEHAEVREDQEMIWKMLETLSEERRQALILRYAEGLKHREIGEIMGKSPVAVKVLIHRSLAALQRNLASKGFEGGAIAAE